MFAFAFADVALLIGCTDQLGKAKGKGRKADDPHLVNKYVYMDVGSL